MTIRTGLTALAFLLGSAGFSHASQTITSPALPIVTNTSAACYLRNVGTHPDLRGPDCLEQLHAWHYQPQ
jgi:hypothetical protein